MKRMFLAIEKAQKLTELTGGTGKFEEKRAVAGRQMKSSPI